MKDVYNFKNVLDTIKFLNYLVIAGIVIGALATEEPYIIGISIAVGIVTWMAMTLFLGMGYCAVQVAINTDPDVSLDSKLKNTSKMKGVSQIADVADNGNEKFTTATDTAVCCYCEERKTKWLDSVGNRCCTDCQKTA